MNREPWMGLQGGELSRRGVVAGDVNGGCTGIAEGLRVQNVGQNPGNEAIPLGDLHGRLPQLEADCVRDGNSLNVPDAGE